ncbi:WD40 repeat domain-containing protein [Nocardia sp. NPDC058480]|uniref:WD40 repeat domain-containing protein n=1 Tax=Nocardia sp. NPDC058480 TaxID=3346522 RepID=UPI0036648AAD
MSLRSLATAAGIVAIILAITITYVALQRDNVGYSISLRQLGEFRGDSDFSFSTDGETIFATTTPPGSNFYNNVAEWGARTQVRSGDMVCDNLERDYIPFQSGFVTAISASPDGKIIAVAGPCGNYPEGYTGGTSIQFWDIKSRELVKTIRTVHSAHYLELTYSPDGKVLYASGTVGANVTSTAAGVDVWDIEQSRLITTLKTGRSGIVTGTTVSPSGETIAVAVESANGFDDGRVMLWNTHGYAPVGLDLTNVRQIEFHPEGELLVAGGNDSSVRLVDVTSSEVIRTMHVPLLCEHRRIDYLSVSPDGRMIVGSGYNMPAIFWKIDDGSVSNSLPRECTDSNRVESGWGEVLFSPTGDLFAMRKGLRITVWSIERSS